MDSLIGSSHLLLEIIWLNAILSGDNAIVIGIAAAGLPPEQRQRAVLFGVAAAAILRIIFSFAASWMLALWWVDIVGGLALLWIAWASSANSPPGRRPRRKPRSARLPRAR